MNYIMCASRSYKDTIQSVTVTYRKAPDGSTIYNKMKTFIDAVKLVHVSAPSHDFEINQFTKVDDGKTYNQSLTATAYITARSKTEQPSSVAIRLNGVSAWVETSVVISNIVDKYEEMIENSLGSGKADSYDIMSVIFELG